MTTVLFACVHNAGRSQMAAALFNQLADATKAKAISAGTQPGPHVHPVVVDAMRELDIDLSGRAPMRLTPEVARQAQLLVTMGCGDECPVVPGTERDDWPLDDPKGKSILEVRAIRDEIAASRRSARRQQGLGPLDWAWPVRGPGPEFTPSARPVRSARCGCPRQRRRGPERQKPARLEPLRACRHRADGRTGSGSRPRQAPTAPR